MTDPRRGRAASDNPANRFAATALEPWPIDLPLDDAGPIKTVFYKDRAKSILARNESPDIPFRWDVNPYRGCEHGCIYCYARPSHEWLGWSAGLDFESRIVVKPEAPELLRAEVSRKRWKREPVCMSGNTDCYQPVERVLGLTRACLEVLRDADNPVLLITKNALITRDLDILEALSARRLVSVTISVTTLDPSLAQVMEPRASAPTKRLDAVAALAARGIPVGVNVSPVIPGLTDEEVPSILEAAKRAGAQRAGYSIVRLPGAVESLFLKWLETARPLRAKKVEQRIRDMRDGALNDARPGMRLRGEGEHARMIDALFSATCRRLGLESTWTAMDREVLAPRPDRNPVQGDLFSS
jgi:DNA repair photolyase